MADNRADIDKLVSQINKLSPTTREILSGLVENLVDHKAVLVEDEKGRPITRYGKLSRDASNANKIAFPKTDEDVDVTTKWCLEMFGYLKISKAPSGVVLNNSKIHAKKGWYREKKEFRKTKKVLGSGNSAEDIVVVIDNYTGCEHAQKTISLTCFNTEEILAMVQLRMRELYAFPELYFFQLVEDKVTLHMEILANAITLNDVINLRIKALLETNAALLKPFSLSVFHNLLEVVHSMHEKGWTHRDLHSGNVMIQKMSDHKMEVKILDFGRACTTDSVYVGNGMGSDFLNALRIFSALYLGYEFNDQDDLKENWRMKVTTRMQEMKENSCLPEEHQNIEIFYIFQKAEVKNFLGMMEKVKELVEKGPVTDVMDKVVPILFPKE